MDLVTTNSVTGLLPPWQQRRHHAQTDQSHADKDGNGNDLNGLGPYLHPPGSQGQRNGGLQRVRSKVASLYRFNKLRYRKLL